MYKMFSTVSFPQYNSAPVKLLYLSGQNESGAKKNNESEKAFVKTKECVWRQK